MRDFYPSRKTTKNIRRQPKIFEDNERKQKKNTNLVECNNIQRTRGLTICAYENFQYILSKSNNVPSFIKFKKKFFCCLACLEHETLSIIKNFNKQMFLIHIKI